LGKKFILVVSLLFTIFIFVIQTEAVVPSILVNGQVLQCDTPPMVKDGSTFVPMRTIFEALGSQVKWDGPTRTVTAVKENTALELVIDGDVKVNGQKINTDAQAKIYENSTMVPLRFVSESLGAKVDWDPYTHTVNITTTTEKTAQQNLVMPADTEVREKKVKFKELLQTSSHNIEAVLTGNWGEGIGDAVLWQDYKYHEVQKEYEEFIKLFPEEYPDLKQAYEIALNAIETEDVGGGRYKVKENYKEDLIKALETFNHYLSK